MFVLPVVNIKISVYQQRRGAESLCDMNICKRGAPLAVFVLNMVYSFKPTVQFETHLPEASLWSCVS